MLVGKERARKVRADLQAMEAVKTAVVAIKPEMICHQININRSNYTSTVERICGSKKGRMKGYGHKPGGIDGLPNSGTKGNAML